VSVCHAMYIHVWHDSYIGDMTHSWIILCIYIVYNCEYIVNTQYIVCCSVLQRCAIRCSVLQCVALRCSVLQCVAVRCSILCTTVSILWIHNILTVEYKFISHVCSWMSHVTYVWTMSRMNESCHLHTNHVTHECFMSDMCKHGQGAAATHCNTLQHAAPHE